MLAQSRITVSIVTLAFTGLEGHICPSLVMDWKDIYIYISLPGNGLE